MGECVRKGLGASEPPRPPAGRLLILAAALRARSAALRAAADEQCARTAGLHTRAPRCAPTCSRCAPAAPIDAPAGGRLDRRAHAQPLWLHGEPRRTPRHGGRQRRVGRMHLRLLPSVSAALGLLFVASANSSYFFPRLRAAGACSGGGVLLYTPGPGTESAAFSSASESSATGTG